MSEFMYTTEESKTINDAVDEAVQSFMKQKGVEAAEKEQRKEIFEALKEKGVPIDKKLFNQLVGERFEGKSSDLIEKHEDVVALEEILRNNSSDDD